MGAVTYGPHAFWGSLLSTPLTLQSHSCWRCNLCGVQLQWKAGALQLLQLTGGISAAEFSHACPTLAWTCTSPNPDNPALPLQPTLLLAKPESNSQSSTCIQLGFPSERLRGEIMPSCYGTSINSVQFLQPQLCHPFGFGFGFMLLGSLSFAHQCTNLFLVDSLKLLRREKRGKTLRYHPILKEDNLIFLFEEFL